MQSDRPLAQQARSTNFDQSFDKANEETGRTTTIFTSQVTAELTNAAG